FAAHGSPELGKMVIRRSDGTTLYQTKELALAKVKLRDHNVDRSLHVVGSEQSLYFRQVFKILELWGFEAAAKCRHISYELVQLAGGKMSSREGTVVPYHGFVAEAEAKALALAREHGISAAPEAVAHRVALAAIKYAFLRVDTNKTIIFAWDQALSFDGNAGPYLQYAYARSNKLLADFAQDVPRLESLDYSPEPAEAHLCRTLADFPDCAAQALSEHAPNLVANYLYDLARAFTDFYQVCPVLKAAGEVCFFRQSLVAAFNSVLSSGALLMGMELPQEM
ncbi:MAG: arginine--tRNA ligase, partial [Candidatus Riflebacteria bacterium RBG_13_59_9]